MKTASIKIGFFKLDAKSDGPDVTWDLYSSDTHINLRMVGDMVYAKVETDDDTETSSFDANDLVYFLKDYSLSLDEINTQLEDL